MSNPHFVTREACPACNGRRMRSLYTCGFDQPPLRRYLEDYYAPQGGVEMEHLAGAVYELCECEDCGLVFQKHVGDDFVMAKLYDQWIDAHKQFEIYERHHPLVHYRNIAHQVMLVGTYFDRAPDTIRVFDFGMGWGDWCRMAAAFGFDACGGELSEKRIAHASRFGIRIVPWDQIPGSDFDFIHAEQVFEHLPRPLETLRHLKKGLKPGGLVYVSVPDAGDIKDRLRVMDWSALKGGPNALTAVAPLEHVNGFTHHSLVRLAREAGLETVHLPASLQYASQSDWRPLKPMLKNLLRPYLNKQLNVGTSLYFRNPASSAASAASSESATAG